VTPDSAKAPLQMPGVLQQGDRAKPTVLAFVGNYLPGYKAGGILRSLVNAVDHLCHDFHFRIVTRDRDLGDEKPFSGVEFNQWQRVGNAQVYYLQPERNRIREIFDLITATPHHVLYLNSFFDPFTVTVLLIRRLGVSGFKQVIVAPRGEFAWGALGQKHLKKMLYIRVARLAGLYEGVTWHASSQFEAVDIAKVMEIRPDAIHTALDLPTKAVREGGDDVEQLSCRSEGLRIVFVSRIARVKNLDYALRILGRVEARVTFHIYGPIEATDYWRECQKLIDLLPGNVKVEYVGSVNPNDVVSVFGRYDLFLFPTCGENYGHVIAEALTAGTPVLISTETPWRNLQEEGFGWDLALADIASFAEAVERYALLTDQERAEKREVIKSRIMARLLDPAVLEANRELFKNASLR